jgi:hypothetical protein
MALCVVDLFEVGIIGDGFYSLLLWDDFIVACHHRDCAGLPSLAAASRTSFS